MPENTMSPFELIYRPALGAAKPLESSKIRLAPLPEGAILQVVGPADGVAAVTAAAGQARLSLRPNGPGQCFLVGDAPMARSAIDALRGTLGDGFAVIDQSHGRIRIAVDGSAVEAVLAKGTGIDLAAFPVGDATSTLIGHISVHLSRLSATRFELMSLRGFAESLWHDVQTMAAEFFDPRH